MIRPIILILVLFIVAVAVIKRRRDSRTSTPGEQDPAPPDLNDEFFEHATGQEPIPFIRIYSNQDKMLIRSILDSSGIRSYMGMHYVGDLLPGVRIQGHTDTVLYIYRSDREDAEELVIDYMRHRVEQLTGNPVTTRQALADAVALLNLKPTSQNQILPEFLEIE